MIKHISFVIPAYNCATMIRETVESVFDGNFDSGDELIIVNDGSIDDTGKVLKTLQIKYPVIILLEHIKNRGCPVARNTGITVAKNPILFSLDSDNILASNSICKLKEFLFNSDADVAAFQRLDYFKKDTNKIEKRWVFKLGITTLADCLMGGRVPINSGNYLFTKNSWKRAGGYPVGAGAIESWGFGIRQLATGCKMVVMPNSCYYHRFGWKSLWIRDSRARNLSLVAFPIIKPFLDLFYKEDVDYILNHKDSWLFALSKHPLRVKESALDKAGIVCHNLFK